MQEYSANYPHIGSIKRRLFSIIGTRLFFIDEIADSADRLSILVCRKAPLQHIVYNTLLAAGMQTLSSMH